MYLDIYFCWLFFGSFFGKHHLGSHLLRFLVAVVCNNNKSIPSHPSLMNVQLLWSSYAGSTVWGSSFANQQFDHVQVVVMHSHMKRSQSILRRREVHFRGVHILDVPLLTYGWRVLTFPAALGLAPRSSNSSATSTMPYLDATCRGVKPFCKWLRESEDRKNDRH